MYKTHLLRTPLGKTIPFLCLFLASLLNAEPKPEVLSPRFFAPESEWTPVDSSKTIGQPSTMYISKGKTKLQVGHLVTHQTLKEGENWADILKSTCTNMTLQMSTLLNMNLPPATPVKVTDLDACRLKVENKATMSVLDHYVFVWKKAEEKNKKAYEAHAVTAIIPMDSQSQGHEMFEKFLKTLRHP